VRTLKWTASNAVYLPDIDAEHQELFQMAEELHQGLTAGLNAEQLQPMVRGLVAHTSRHFTKEERLMRSVRCPSYEWHKKQHDLARSQLRFLERRVRKGDTEAALVLLHYLANWLHSHTSLTDRMMAAYLRNYSRANPAIAS
jgi:hemerythrin